MISLEELVTSIQKSTLAAAQLISQKNTELLDLYFVEVHGDEVDEIARRSLDTSAAAISSIDSESARAALRQAGEALQDAAKAVSGQEIKSTSWMRPRTVVMEYPNITAEGASVHLVHVPLISLAPMAMSEIKELRFKTDLEIMVSEDDQLQISFYKAGAAHADSQNESGCKAEIEIVVNAAPPAEGLRKIIEGYERALRAQIPG